MVKIKVLGPGQYQTYPLTDDMIEVGDLSEWSKNNIDPKKKNRDRIHELKGKLNSTDYIVIKHAEGLIPDAEFETYKRQRQNWRDEINELEKQNESLS